MKCKFLPLCVAILWPALAVGQTAVSAWTMQFANSRVPQFAEKGKENTKMLVVELTFRNDNPEQSLIEMKQENFQATHDSKPLEVLGLLFQMGNAAGARRMSYSGGMKRMETVSEKIGDDSEIYFDTPGPVNLLVDPGKTYTQRILLRRPRGHKPIRLRFKDLPEIEVKLPG